MRDKLTKGQQTRELIIHQSIELFSREGFFKSSIQKVADACGIAQTAVLYHFKNKEELVHAVLESVVLSNHNYVSQGVKAEWGALQMLNHHFEANLDWAHKHGKESQLISLLFYTATFDSSFRDLYRRIETVAQNRIEGLLLKGQEEEVFHFEEPADLVARTLHDSLLGSVVKIISAGEPIQKARKRQRECWQILTDSLLKLET